MNTVSINRALRPERFDDVLGQDALCERLRIRVDAAKMRGEPLEHTILSGPPGLGKTTLAHVLANEMGGKLLTANAPAMTSVGDAVGILMRLGRNDVLFIDEIHRLPVAVEEGLYSALEDWAVDHLVGEGNKSQLIRIPLPPFTMIGATTCAGGVSLPMKARFGIQETLELYEPAGLALIIRANAAKLNVEIDDDAINMLACRSRGTPRVANRLLKAARDYACTRGNGRLDADTMNQCLRTAGIDPIGLDSADRAYLRCIMEQYEGGPVGLDALAATLGEASETLANCLEPFMLRGGLIRRTRAGRMITDRARAHLI